MREIKFRAWLNNEMVNDPIIYGVNGNQMAVGSSINEGINSFFKDGEGKYVLMQYTGLKDKNGKEIFEGDILIWHNPDDGRILELGAVIFEKGTFGTRHPVNDWSWLTPSEDEILGNIYENPELLKGEER